jgi:hypothetical protein
MLAATSAVLFVSPAATAQTIADVCQPPAVRGVSDFTIDARSGDFEGKTRHGQGDVVRIVVFNKNPYVYEYRLVVESAPVPGPSPSDFLASFGLKFETPDTGAPKAAVEKADKTAKGAPPAAAVKPCPSAGALQDGTGSLIEALGAAVGEWKKVEAPLETASKAREKAGKAFDDPQATCSSLQNASTQLLAALSVFEFKPEELQKSLQVLTARAALQEDLIAKVAKEAPAACSAELQSARVSLAGARTEADKLSRNLTMAQEAVKGITAVKNTVETVLATPGAFVQVRSTGDFDEPTNVTVTLDRRVKKPDAPFATLVSRKINFGGRALFAVSGGWSVGWVRRLEYAARDGQPRNREGEPVGDADKAVPIAEEIENSMPRSGLALLGHARIAHLTKWGFSGIHGTLGLTPQSDNNATHGEVFLGGSLSFANELFFLSLGAYRGWQQTLEGTFYPGKALPEGTSTVPTGSDEKWGWGLGVSVRLR